MPAHKRRRPWPKPTESFETEIKLGWVGHGGTISFFHPKRNKCKVVTAKLNRSAKGSWTCYRFPHRTDRMVGGIPSGHQFAAASSALAAARKFHRQFLTGWFD